MPIQNSLLKVPLEFHAKSYAVVNTCIDEHEVKKCSRDEIKIADIYNTHWMRVYLTPKCEKGKK